MDKERLTYLKNLDVLLVGIYKDGINLTRFDKILPSDYLGGFPPVEGLQTSPYHSQVLCIEYLIKEGYVKIRNGKYLLTAEGIERVKGNSFESEYRNSNDATILNRKVQTTTIARNKWSLVLSIIAIIISILALGISIWLKRG